MAAWRLGAYDSYDTVAVTSAVCAPAREGQPHTVFSCVIRDDPNRQQAMDCRISTAPTLQEAVAKACGQAMELLCQAGDSGQAVSGVHCSHCPTPNEPKCGAFARLPRYLGR